jgi:hypothetical protein
MLNEKRAYTAVLLAFMLVFSMTTTSLAQQCISDLSTVYIGGKSPGADGKIHITYGFAEAPSEAVKNSVSTGFSQWNGVSGATKVVFEAAVPGALPDLEFKSSDSANKTGGCAGYRQATDRVYYSPGFQQAAQASTSAGATMIAHEIGHFLGMDEAGSNPSTPTIMNNGSGSVSCLDSAQNVTTKAVLPIDGTAAGGCVQQARTTHVIGGVGGGGGDPGDGYYYEPYYGGSCYARYIVTDYYLCSSDYSYCEYQYSNWDFIGIVCY